MLYEFSLFSCSLYSGILTSVPMLLLRPVLIPFHGIVKKSAPQVLTVNHGDNFANHFSPADAENTLRTPHFITTQDPSLQPIPVHTMIIFFQIYWAPVYGLHMVARMLQTNWDKGGKQQQREVSPNHVQAICGHSIDWLEELKWFSSWRVERKHFVIGTSRSAERALKLAKFHLTSRGES